MTQAAIVTITGAAGQIGYQLAFRIASGQLLGANRPVILHLLEIPPALDALNGVAMELEDCAFPTLQGVVATDQPDVSFENADYALLVGAKPRGAGMERADLLKGNAAIFSVQGKSLNDHASRDVKVLVVGNPANTNALIARQNAPDLNPANFTAMMRLDHNRALAQLAGKTGSHVNQIKHMTIWGNHSATQVTAMRRTWSTSNGSSTRSFQPCSNVVRRLSKHADCPAPLRRRPRPSITCATGRWARRATTGSAWRSRRTAAMVSNRALSIRTRFGAARANTKSSRGSRSVILVASGWQRVRRNCVRRNCVRNGLPSPTCCKGL